MSTTSIRVEQKTHQRLVDLAKNQRRSMTQIVTEAIEKYERDLFWEQAREGYERMNADPEDRVAFDEELALWDSTLNDGLEDSPYDEDE